MAFARIATLRVSDQSYDLIYFRYGFGRGTDKKGRPTTRIQGGYIQLVMESTKSTELLELFFNTDPEYPTDHRPRVISGSVEVCDPEDGLVIRRLVFEEAFIVRSGEAMHTDSPLPMMETITISPLRLDIDHTIRLDRHWPQAPHGWQEFVQEERPVMQAAAEEPDKPECTVYFRRRSDYDSSFGFDWLRVGDTDEVGCGWYKDSMGSVAAYDRFVQQYSTPFVQEWRKQYDKYKATAEYIVPWVTLMDGATAKLRVKMQVHKPSGELQVKITGSGQSVLSANIATISADRTGDYYNDTDLVVTCNGTFSSPTALEVYAGSELVGKLNFVPNMKIYRPKVAIVTVKTKRGNTIHRRQPDENILNSMKRLLGQAYIVPDFQFVELDLSEPVIIKPLESSGSEFQGIIDIEAYGGSEGGRGIQHLGIKKGDHRSLIEIIWTSSSIINTGARYGVNRFRGFHEFMNKMLYMQHQPLEDGLKTALKVYFLNESIAVPADGEVNGVALKDERAACIAKFGYNSVTPTHELLHCFSLNEAFPNEEEPNNLSKNGTHTFTKTLTDNIMDYDWNYDNVEDRKSLWYWQIKEVWAYLKGLGL